MATRRAVPVSSPPAPRREYWRGLVEAHRRSGLSQAAFCRRRGLRKGTLSFWKWKLAQEAGAGPGRAADIPARPATPPIFVPIQLGSPRAPRAAGESPAERDGNGEVEIALGRRGLVRVRGPVDPAWLVAVVRGVEALGC
jgi:hypothetical protein